MAQGGIRKFARLDMRCINQRSSGWLFRADLDGQHVVSKPSEGHIRQGHGCAA